MTADQKADLLLRRTCTVMNALRDSYPRLVLEFPDLNVHMAAAADHLACLEGAILIEAVAHRVNLEGDDLSRIVEAAHQTIRDHVSAIKLRN
jgi:hypothetical protein